MLVEKNKKKIIYSMFFISLATLWGCGVSKENSVEIKQTEIKHMTSNESEIVVWTFSPYDPEHTLGGSGIDKRGSRYTWGGCSKKYNTWDNTVPVLILNNCNTHAVNGPYISFPGSSQSRGIGEVEADFIFNMALVEYREDKGRCTGVNNYGGCMSYSYEYYKDVPNHALYNIDIFTNIGKTILASVAEFSISESELDNVRKSKAKFLKKTLKMPPFEIPQNLKNLEFRIEKVREFSTNAIHTVGLSEVRFKWFKAP